ncbi:hypothetical protein L6452_01843 [Arctium lappa]|uniref:Uncharacterized protein n=1 Tax=Arctium lappa TaxID=4217 RepID=A0ACB9FHR4_ARCLA|nr:hypothetical protein L6452_01843 [Arctium lappa]
MISESFNRLWFTIFFPVISYVLARFFCCLSPHEVRLLFINEKQMKKWFYIPLQPSVDIRNTQPAAAAERALISLANFQSRFVFFIIQPSIYDS